MECDHVADQGDEGLKVSHQGSQPYLSHSVMIRDPNFV